jgi:hypothetical protein
MQRKEVNPMVNKAVIRKNRKRKVGHMFEVGFKGYYREISEHFTKHIRANNSEEAFKKFCRMQKIRDTTLQHAENLQWWDGEWLMLYRYVREVEVIPCPHCDGLGVITSLAR